MPTTKSLTLARRAANLALTKKASNVVILHLKSLSDVTDYYVICSGDSNTHVRAIADAIDDGMRDAGNRVWRKEGLQNLQWVLLDLVDVVVHVFQRETRSFYDLERLWGDAKIEHVVDEPPAPAATTTKTTGAKSTKKRSE